MRFNDFINVMPLLKDHYGFYVKWLNKNERSGWYSWKTFTDRYDFTKIQVIKCKYKPIYDEYADIDYELTLRKI